MKVILVIDLVTLLQLLRSDDNPLATSEGLLGSSKSESEPESKRTIRIFISFLQIQYDRIIIVIYYHKMYSP